ncbi:MAG: glycosyltransferase family 2 protein [Nitrospirota bacterium]
MLITIVIPVYNEEATIRNILEKVQAVNFPIEKEIIIVDDCSTDGTRQILEDIDSSKNRSYKIIFHNSNQGKGSALMSGFKEAKGDIVIIQDADLEYDPSEYPKLIQPILDGKADVVYGSRFKGEGPHRVLFFWHYVGNRILTTMSNIFTNLNLTDMETGYKAFRRDILSKIVLKEKRFGFEPEITAKLARLGCRIYEVGISYSGRTYLEGKKIKWKDGFRAMWCIVKYSLFS